MEQKTLAPVPLGICALAAKLRWGAQLCARVNLRIHSLWLRTLLNGSRVNVRVKGTLRMRRLGDCRYFERLLQV